MNFTAETRGRIDKLVADALPQYSRAALHKLFATDHILLDGIIVKPGHKVRAGAVISVDLSLLEQDQQVVELPILYEDDDVVVIDKPIGIISHARGRYWYEPSVASFLRYHTLKGSSTAQGTIIPNATHTPNNLVTRSYPLSTLASTENDRAGIVHRLDRATSGVMICAKNDTALSFLQKQFSDRTVTKTYIAVLDGVPAEPEAIIDAPIERNPKKPSMFRVGPNGKLAQTHYKVLKQSGNKCLVEFTPKTGRTHQLRVHAVYIKCPILGDDFYGTVGDRLYLHAHTLKIKLPNGEEKLFTSSLPKDFEDAVR